jgi:hypothetical protein
LSTLASPAAILQSHLTKFPATSLRLGNSEGRRPHPPHFPLFGGGTIVFRRHVSSTLDFLRRRTLLYKMLREEGPRRACRDPSEPKIRKSTLNPEPDIQESAGRRTSRRESLEPTFVRPKKGVAVRDGRTATKSSSSGQNRLPGKWPLHDAGATDSTLILSPSKTPVTFTDSPAYFLNSDWLSSL